MTEVTKQFKLWLPEDEITALKESINEPISPLFRKIIQSMILDAPMPSGVSLETSEIILQAKARIGLMKKEQERQDFIKSELFKFLSEKRIPIIYARNGQAKAKKLCLELIPVFRESGYLLPDCFVKPLINEYLRWIVASGEVAEQYLEAQEGAA